MGGVVDAVVDVVSGVFGVVGDVFGDIFSVDQPDVADDGKSSQQKKQLIRASRAPKQIIYGTAKVSGVWVFGNEQAGSQEEGEKLYMAVGIAGHGVSDITTIWLGDRYISEFGNKASCQIQNNPTTSYNWSAPQWQSDMIGLGTTWAALVLTYDRELYTSGIPTPKFLVNGKNDIYDPRTGTYGYTDNAALVILDYVMTAMNIPLSRIILSGTGSFIAAANLCDEIIQNSDGSSSNRYTINGMLDEGEDIGEVLSKMLLCCDATLIRTNGNLGLLPAAYYGPADFTLTSSDITGSVSITPENDLANAVNTMKGSYIEASEDYSEVDFPPIVDQEEFNRVGYEINDDVNFEYVTDTFQAQRIADIKLKRSITGGGISLTTSLRGMYCGVGRVINLVIPEVGIDGEYRVLKQSVNLLEGQCELEIAPDNPDIYDDAIGDPYTPPAIVSLPVGGVPSPTSVQFIVESIGDAVQGYLLWSQPSIYGNITGSEIVILDVNDVVVLSGVSYGEKYDVNALPLGNYTAKVRNIGINNAVSGYTVTNIVISEPPIPTSCTVTASNWNILLAPNVASGIPSGTLFEYYHLEDTNDPLQAPPAYDNTDFNLADFVGTGSSFNNGGLTPSRYQHYWIRSITSYGKSDFFYLESQTTREQDLVTTVVERLVSVEIVSSNYVQGERGYKLFGANDPANNGNAEFNDVVVRGVVESQNFATNNSGFQIIGDGGANDGYAEFNNIKARGDIQATSIEAGIVNVIDTLMIQGEAVTVQQATTRTGEFQTPNGNFATVISDSIYFSTEGTLVVSFGCFGDNISPTTRRNQMKIFVNGNAEYDDTVNGFSWPFLEFGKFLSHSIVVPNVVGNVTVSVQFATGYIGSNGFYISTGIRSTYCDPWLILSGAKR